MFTRTSLFATALLLAAAPAFAQSATGSAATPSVMPTQTVRPATPAVTTPASPAVQGSATTPAKPATERQVTAPRPAQDGKVAGQATQPNAPVKAN